MENDLSNSFYKKEHYTCPDFIQKYFKDPECSLYGWGPLQLYPAHTEIFRQDSPSSAVYFIAAGSVKLSWINPDGNEVIAGLRHQNWLMGAPSVILGCPYSFTISTLTESSLRCISAQKFLELINTNNEFSMHVMKVLSQEIFNHAKKLVMLGCVPSKQRLRDLLNTFIPYEHSKVKQLKIHLPLKHKELAQILAVTPEHLSRLLKELEKEHFIIREKDGSIILNPHSRNM
jgi:CRP/FNR family transcriptional regulator